MTFVLDSSTCLSWVLPDEVPTASAERARSQLGREQALVPAIWPLEVGNALLMVERRGRLEPGRGSEVLSQLLRLPIALAAETCAWGFGASSWPSGVHQLALERNLTTYDACYVLLALQRGLPIASDDRDVLRAARELSVPVLGE